jgi:hypothetical protein
MTYLTGKRFKTLDDGKTCIIVSEPFREPSIFACDGQTPCRWKTFVSVLWDDGSMEGAVDIEELKIVEEDAGYAVCATWPDDEDGELIMETYMKYSSLEDARNRTADGTFKDKNPRIGKIIFPFE